MTTRTAIPNDRSVEIPCGTVRLQGFLEIPDRPRGIVIFVHGSGSGRLSPRNLAVAASLRKDRLGTLLFDLLTPEEAALRGNVFDIELLAGRLEVVTAWLREKPETAGLPIGYFGASTGAAAALVAAARAGDGIAAVVSRGGRPDLARDSLARVTAPTLLIVGSRDEYVLSLNRGALAGLRCTKRLEVIPGATHLFEEPGALEEVAARAGGWFVAQFAGET